MPHIPGTLGHLSEDNDLCHMILVLTMIIDTMWLIMGVWGCSFVYLMLIVHDLEVCHVYVLGYDLFITCVPQLLEQSF